MRLKSRDNIILTTVFAVIGALSIIIYFIFRSIVFLGPGYNFWDRIFAIMLLMGDLFFFVNSIGYSIDVIRANYYYVNKFEKEHYFLTVAEPDVAVFITAFNEDGGTLEGTVSICALMSYRNKKIYLLDDSSDPELIITAREIADRYGIEYRHRKDRRGYKAGAINEVLKEIDAEYLLVLDADQRPSHDFLNEIVPIMESEIELAFVQTPQFYVNRKINRVAEAAYAQQAVFYTYICEGKSVANAVFACGTNMVMRVSALRDVGGFDEETVTEDLATSFNLHRKGYSSYYYNHVFVEGEGPMNIPGYYKQQMRWAYGNITVLKKVLWNLITDPGSMTLAQWAEYLLSCTWYFVGLAYFFLMLCPVAFLLFDIHPFHVTDNVAYIFCYLPYLIFSFFQFFVTMYMRGYSAREILLGITTTFLTFPIFMKATFYALIGRKIPFVVTPKVSDGRTPLKYFLPQIAMMILITISAVIGFVKIFHQFTVPLLMNILWCLYYLVLIQRFRYFLENGSEASTYYKDIFKVDRQEERD
ncbi:MAG: cellulose synthase catalytic subunit [Methanotrichaceae archaeon]|jgi:cellulose synthase (UDP-forming)